MHLHIPIPEFQYYEWIILFTWCLGSSHLASHVYSRYCINLHVNPLVIQCIVKAIICLAAMSLFSIKPLFSTTLLWQMASIPIGLLLGWLVSEFEITMNRFVQRKKNKTHADKIKKNNFYYSNKEPGHFVLSLAPIVSLKKKMNLQRLHAHYAEHESKQQKFSLMIILLIALFEEILFRGYLVQYCYLLPDCMVPITLVMTVILFGLSHASFGLWQMMAKTILGGCCLMAVLLCHTILPALIIHSYLNWVAFRYQH